MSVIMLGNLSVPQIESRLGIKLNYDDESIMNKTRQEPVNNTPLADGCWHCFDMPFMIVADTKVTAESICEILKKYDTSKFKEPIRVSWEK